MSDTTSDAKQRQQALDCTRSFIVQAPAGSGKTELLIQRYLALLARAERAPEEIIAVTFTRKAAFEMRARIITAIETAATEAMPQQTHELTTYQLAQAVLKRDQQLEWQLLINPNRLKIQTIDSLCARLTTMMPILAKFGAQPKISDDVSALYQQAALDILTTLDTEQPWSEALATILLYLDNDHAKALRLFINMLARRDQWLLHIMAQNPRKLLEQSLQNLIDEQLQKLYGGLIDTYAYELIPLIRFAAAHVNAQNNPGLYALRDINELPLPCWQALHQWQAITHLLITKKESFRNRYTAEQGFPAVTSATSRGEKQLFQTMKSRMLNLANELKEDAQLHRHLCETQALPSACYSDQQWRIIDALVAVLPTLAAQLLILFKQYGIVDHTEVSLKALQALGTTESPTDLALYMDYQIRHILVDEFQDTSSNQFRLLERLTQGWQAGDGRSLFLVGDPMQSIYRFRKADVGLFLQAQQHGIGAIKLQPIRLSSNFRSSKIIIGWTNKNFSTILPEKDDLQTGAIHYEMSQAALDDDTPNTGVTIHPLIDQGQSTEADHIATIIHQQWQQDANAKIAILVQARSHLTEIIPRLKAANINYRAIEIEKLSHRIVVQDLLALTRALLYPADRIAWFAVLRAPWCGLSLADLLTISGHNQQMILLEQLENYSQLPLSDDGMKRLHRVVPILLASVKQRRRLPLAQWLETTWYALGGPACIHQLTELGDVKAFLQLLTVLASGGDINDIQQLEQALDNLAGATQTNMHQAVDIMTIHKAKGLEFDCVIVPGLERQTKSDAHPLIIWQEHSREQGLELVLAPIKHSLSAEDPIYDYLRRQESNKARNELSRLLYVAVTRAKKQLHLIAQLNADSNGELKAPSHGSMLAKLWQPFSAAVAHAQIINSEKKEPATHNLPSTRKLHRLISDWQQPLSLFYYQLKPKRSYNNPVQTLYWRSDSAKHVGTLIHRLLKKLALQKGLEWDPQEQMPYINSALLNLGVPLSELRTSCAQVLKAIAQCLHDPKGQWILAHHHEDAQAEYPISVVTEQGIQHLIIDRTFITNGIRWIIDYKTTHFPGGGMDNFLALEQQNHKTQLEHYANAFKLRETRPIRLGLYYPLLATFVEIKHE